MGKARIVSHLGDGLYNIEVLHARERIDAEIARLEEQIAELAQRRDDAAQAVSDVEQEIAALRAELLEKIEAQRVARLELAERTFEQMQDLASFYAMQAATSNNNRNRAESYLNG